VSKLGAFRRGQVTWSQDFRGKWSPPANILIPRERQLIATTLLLTFLYNETLQQTFRPVLSKLSKRRQFRQFIPHFKKVRGSVEPWLMARCKARVEFLLSVIERLRRYRAKCVKTRCYQERVGHLEPRFRGRGRPWGIFFSFYKTRHILLSDSSNCTLLRAVVLTQYRRVTDRQTDRRTELP